MTESTRTQASLHQMEKWLENCIPEKTEQKIMELAGAMQKKLHEYLKGTISETTPKNSQRFREVTKSNNSGHRQDHSP